MRKARKPVKRRENIKLARITASHCIIGGDNVQAASSLQSHSLFEMSPSSICSCWRRFAHSLADKSKCAKLEITDIVDRSLLR